MRLGESRIDLLLESGDGAALRRAAAGVEVSAWRCRVADGVEVSAWRCRVADGAMRLLGEVPVHL